MLVIGAGEMGKLTAMHLKAQGIASLAITSRTLAHAQELADEVGGVVTPWDALPQALLDSDIVITVTGSPTPILTRRRSRRRCRPAARGRCFSSTSPCRATSTPDAAEIEQVFLYNIDDLQAIVRENLEKRGAEVGRAEQIVDDEVQKFVDVATRRGAAVPTVVALRQRFETIRQSELERLEPKLAGLPPEARARVDEITRLIVEKLLLHPTEQLKNAGDAELVSRSTRTRSAGCLRSATKDKGRGPDAMKIGTRGSALALWQARTVARLIAGARWSACEIVDHPHCRR